MSYMMSIGWRLSAHLTHAVMRPRIDVFLRDVMRWRTGRMVAQNQTYDEFRRWAIRAGRDDPKRRPELCSELASLAALYGQLTGTANEHRSVSVKREHRHLRAMGIHVHRPFTLRLLWDAQRGKERGPEEKALVPTLGAISSWITRAWLCRPLVLRSWKGVRPTCPHARYH